MQTPPNQKLSKLVVCLLAASIGTQAFAATYVFRQFSKGLVAPIVIIAPTITGFEVLPMQFGAPDFLLVAPTSDSPGAFSYVSGAPEVAIVSGSTVTIVGPGATTITANQDAYGNYSAGSTSAILTVSAAAPTVAGIAPRVGPVGNARTITITGTNFDAQTTVTIGGLPATSVTILDSTILTARAPTALSVAGDYDVVVSKGAQGAYTATKAYTAAVSVAVTNTSPLNLNGQTASRILVMVPVNYQVCGIDASALTGNKVLYIENSGTIAGKGGNGATTNAIAQPGQAAIKSGVPLVIDNTAGNIVGGGGGGGFGFSYHATYAWSYFGGGGGAGACDGGAGGTGGGAFGGPGSPGNSSGGLGRNGPTGMPSGGTGGSYGARGNDGLSTQVPTNGQSVWPTAAVGGAAVQAGGKSITWLGGHTTTQVKGTAY